MDLEIRSAEDDRWPELSLKVPVKVGLSVLPIPRWLSAADVRALHLAYEECIWRLVLRC